MKRVEMADAKVLWRKSAEFWLRNVKQVDDQTTEDVLALLDYPEKRKTLRWAAAYGRGQVYTSAIMEAGTTLAELQIIRGEEVR